jgi:molybdopterin synthase catalytic subunit
LIEARSIASVYRTEGAASKDGQWLGYNRGVNVTVLLFASLAQTAGVRRLELPWSDGDTVASVRDQVVSRYPSLERFLPNLVYALNEEYAELEQAVPKGATIALIPPVSGG